MWSIVCQAVGPRDLILGMHVQLDSGRNLVYVGIPGRWGGGGGGGDGGTAVM